VHKRHGILGIQRLVIIGPRLLLRLLLLESLNGDQRPCLMLLDFFGSGISLHGVHELCVVSIAFVTLVVHEVIVHVRLHKTIVAQNSSSPFTVATRHGLASPISLHLLPQLLKNIIWEETFVA